MSRRGQRRATIAGWALVLALTCLGCGARTDLAIAERDAAVDDPMEPTPQATRFVDLAAADTHSCAVTDVGTVLCWGSNRRGDLGLGTMGPGPYEPTRVPGLTDVTDVTAHRATCVRRRGGSVWCWGTNEDYWLGPDRAMREPSPQRIDGIDDATQVSLGNGHACVVDGDGSVLCWGLNTCDQLGHSEGRPEHAGPARVEGVEGAVQISAGACHTCARLEDGSARCWGNNTQGQLGSPGAEGLPPVTPDTAEPLVDITASSACTCAASRSGSQCWGHGLYGALGLGDTRSRPRPNAVPGVGPSLDIDTDCASTCVAEADGTVQCWGSGSFGILGLPDADRELAPVAHPGVRDAVRIVTGFEHMCALLEDGRIQCWGRNQHGQLGDGREEHHGELTTIDASDV